MKQFLIEIIISWKIPHPQETQFFATQLHIAINRYTYGKIVGKATLNSVQKYFGGIACFSFHAYSYNVIMEISYVIICKT